MSLDAAGHLLLAEGHLRKAKEKLDQEPWLLPSRDRFGASIATREAINYVRQALRELKGEEEP